MSKIVLGNAPGGRAELDLEILLRTRALVQANSGGGKSWLLRRLAEQLFGKVHVILVDPEGEFSTLREKLDCVLVGPGGETPADPRSAELLAHKLLELRASAVCDLYEMKPVDRHRWVRLFLEALIDAPKKFWHPLIVIVDEAHQFCPEKGAGESEAADAMIALATRGRKRGYCSVFATQRLGKLRKDAAAELTNVLIGLTTIDIDRKRAADALGIYGKDQRQFFDEVKTFQPGMFFALGRAISNERVLVRVGPVMTTHPEPGSSKHSAEPPPPPEKVKALLPKLADLPKAAEEKAKTESELRKEIRTLKAQLAARGPSNPKVKQAPRAVTVTVPDYGTARRILREAREGLTRELRQGLATAITALDRGLDKLLQDLSALEKSSKPAASLVPPTSANHGRPNGSAAVSASVGDPEVARAIGKTPLQMLKVLATWHPATITRAQLAQQIRIRKRGSSMRTYLTTLRTRGYLEEQGEELRASATALDLVGDQTAGVPQTTEEVLALWKPKVGKTPALMLDALIAAAGEPMQREDLAAAVGIAPEGSSMRTYLTTLRTSGLLVDAGDGRVAANKDGLFL